LITGVSLNKGNSYHKLGEKFGIDDKELAKEENDVYDPRHENTNGRSRYETSHTANRTATSSPTSKSSFRRLPND